MESAKLQKVDAGGAAGERAANPQHRALRVTTLSLEATGQRAGSVHLAERLLFPSSTHRAFHGERAGKNGCGRLGETPVWSVLCDA
jgi:hypothetical protein